MKIAIIDNERKEQDIIEKYLLEWLLGHGCVARLAEETISVKEAFGVLAKKLEPYTYFVKCHRAYLVNMRYVSMILKTELLLDDKEIIPVSRNQLKTVQSEFLRYYHS